MIKRVFTRRTRDRFAGSLVAATTDNASSVTATYNTLTAANPDVEGAITGVVTGLVQSTLGPDGLPVEFNSGRPATSTLRASSCGGRQFHRLNSVVIAGTTYTYQSRNFAVRHQQQLLSRWSEWVQRRRHRLHLGRAPGQFVTPAGGSVTFSLGSDDDAWVFLNGQLVVDNGGVHALATARLRDDLEPGTNTVEVFMADRHVVQAGLYFDADVTLNPAVPEPSTWAMMLCGFAGLGFVGYRARARRAAIPA